MVLARAFLLAAVALGASSCSSCAFAAVCTADEDCPVGARCFDGTCSDVREGEGEGEGEDPAEGEGEGEGEAPSGPRLRAGAFSSLHARAGATVRGALVLDDGFEGHPPLCDAQRRCVSGAFAP